jgi:uncharacterized membrane protein
MTQATPATAYERRWPVALTTLGVLAVLALLPGRLRYLPPSIIYVVGCVVVGPLIGVGLTRASARWLRIERVAVRGFFLVATVLTLVSLSKLLKAMVYGATELSGLELLASSIALWLTNVMIYSLLYWQIDRGGPEARLNDAGKRVDWYFPQEDAPENVAPADWRPTFVDYLYLAYSTATAFSTTEVAPMTSRAKLLMMLESMISLLVIVVIGARAINILG